MNKAKDTNLSKTQTWPQDLDQNNEDTILASPLPQEIYVDLFGLLYEDYNGISSFYTDYEKFCDLKVAKDFPTQKEFAQ